MGFPNLKRCRHSHPSYFLNEGAFEVLRHFEQIDHITADLKHQNLHQDEQEALAMAALAYRYDPTDGPAPVTPSHSCCRAVVKTVAVTSGLASTAFKRTP